MMWISFPFLIATIVCLFRRSKRIDTLLEEILKWGKIAKEKSDAQTDEEKAKVDWEKCAAATTTSYVHWSHESSATTEKVQQQNLQVILSQQNKVFIALLENSKKQ